MSPAPCRVLALNLGSTSLKAGIHVRDAHDWLREGRSAIELDSRAPAADHGLQALVAQWPAEEDAPDVIVHRIVHGGGRQAAVEIDDGVLAELDALAPLAPLHQPPALELVRLSRLRWPAARQWAAFDTSWHATMPLEHRVMPLPKALFAGGVRRYGFHGLAFQSSLRQLRAQAPERADGRVVLAHLGGGSSVCAVRGGHSVNTTMGMTPLDGIPMATRPGSLDPGVLLHLQRAFGFDEEAIDRMLWRESGLKGLSGESGDMRVLLASASDDARLAVDVYVSAVMQAIAAMAACIGGLDTLVFSGGVGAQASPVRQRIVGGLAWLGLPVDEDAPVAAMHGPRVFVVGVDEEAELFAQWRGAQPATLSLGRS